MYQEYILFGIFVEKTFFSLHLGQKVRATQFVGIFFYLSYLGKAKLPS